MKFTPFVCVCLLTLSGYAFAGEANKPVRVYLPVPLTGTALGSKLCNVLVAYLGENTLPLEQAHVFATAEEFSPFPTPQDYLLQDRSPLSRPMRALAAALLEARQTDGQSLAETDARLNPYDSIRKLEFGIRYGLREYQIIAAAKDYPASWTQSAAGVFEEAPASRGLVWMVNDQFDLVPELIAALPEDENVYELNGMSHVNRVIPEPVLARMQQYDLASELLGLPHHAWGIVRHNASVYRSSDVGITPSERSYYVVRSSKGRAWLGYLVEQSVTLGTHFVDSDDVYRKHFANGITTTRTSVDNTYSIIAHFDRFGNRMEPWSLGSLMAMPNGRKTSRITTVEKPRYYNGRPLILPAKTTRSPIAKLKQPSNGQKSLVPLIENRQPIELASKPPQLALNELSAKWKTAKLVATDVVGPFSTQSDKTHRPEPLVSSGQYLFIQKPAVLIDVVTGRVIQKYDSTAPIFSAVFSLDGKTLYWGHLENWVSVVDVASGKITKRFQTANEPGLASVPILKLRSLSERYLSFDTSDTHSQDAGVYVLDLETQKSAQILSGFGSQEFWSSKLYAFNYYSGLTSVALGIESTIQAGKPKRSSTKVVIGTQKQTNHTENKEYLLLSTSGDHFIARSYQNGDALVVAREEDGWLRKLNVPGALEQRKLLSSNTDMKGQSLLVGLSELGTVTYWTVSDEESLPQTLPIGDVEDIAVLPSGNLVATRDRRGTIAIWNLSMGNEQLLSVPSKGSSRMDFSRDGRSLYIWDGTSRLTVLSTWHLPEEPPK